MKATMLRLLGSIGLLLPVFRVWELMRTFGADRNNLEPDGLPLPSPALMVRVAGTASAEWFVESGGLSEKSIRASLERAGAPIESLRNILDFGCGCGRVLRRWRNLDARVYGSDLSGPAIEWCHSHLPFAEVGINGLEPPLSYADASFEFVYALSVMTHLPISTQFAWCDELRRILRPGGLLMISLHGDAYEDKLRGDERIVYANGDCVVRWADAAGSNLCTTFHPLSFVRNQLAQGWDFVEHVPRGALGNPVQDILLLRKFAS